MAYSPTPWPGGALPMRPNATPPPEYDDDEDDNMVIGIDFGTTYSGVAWATAADFTSNQINLITTWPGTGREEGKAPTELFYEDNQVMWGYEIPADADPVRWFKLLLLKDEDLDDQLRSSEFLLRGRKMLRENNKTAVDLIADYLRALWKHVLETINKSRGESVVEALTFNVVITVPAIWKGYARQGMHEAAKKSGILDFRPAGTTTLTFAPEPEAAALSTLCEPGRRAKKGDVYVIADAGGGTVDLISYKVDKVAPMAIHEVVEGIGGLCGGIFIDEAFEHMCKARLGRRWDRLSKAGIKEIMKGEWEYAIKPQFKPMATQKEYIVGIPAEAFGKTSLDDATREPYIKNGRIHFNGSHIETAFTEAFSGIEKLIDAQIKKANQRGVSITGIILVGGLGASPYLYEHLKTRHSRAGITVLQSGGIQPRTAICRGAVYKGFLGGAGNSPEGGLIVDSPITITSTISRVNVGIKYNAEFDENLHLEEDKKWCEHEGIYRAKNQLQWYLKRGENVSAKTPIRHPFCQTYDKEYTGICSIRMVQSDDIVAPTRCPSDMKETCRIDWSLDQAGLSGHPEVEEFNSAANGKKMKRIHFDVEMIPSGACAEFAVDFAGKKLGKSNVRIEFQ